ncbi:helix-turn-helix transcriptional regulator [Streptomyces xanthophaeus]|uniref:Helix-turn-helix domain-containing protein n=1 Tax=Streptomyces xanthophaeus TaxID=67385 RepID=A0A919LE36_9ACTN|nr:hypothetical protein Sxan_15160 [Streptomyces xanthophaeus]
MRPSAASASSCVTDRLWTTAEAADYLGLAAKTLRNKRSAGQGPAYVMLPGHRWAYYQPSDVKAWQKKNTRVINPETKTNTRRRAR